jgi:pilus assembly protein CpaE
MMKKDRTILVRLNTKKPDVQTGLETAIGSIGGMEIQQNRNGRPSDLLIFELGKESEKDFLLIRSLLNAGEVGEVFLTADSDDPRILRQAMKTGIKEFFPQPLKEEELRQALQLFKKRVTDLNNREVSRQGHIITVLGSKGGIGTTTIAVNLSVNMAEIDRLSSVALIDMNKTFGEIPLFLSFKPTFDWNELVKNVDRLDVSFLMNALAKHPSGVYVLPSPARLSGNGSSTPDIIEHILRFMQRMFDFIIIDGGHSLDESSLRILEISDTVLLVSSLSLPYLFTTSKILESLEHMGYPSKERVKIVANRYIKGSEISVEDAEGNLRNKIFWTIPNDYKTTISAINQGKVLSRIAPKTAVAKNLQDLAGRFLYGEEENKKQERKGWRLFKGR